MGARGGRVERAINRSTCRFMSLLPGPRSCRDSIGFHSHLIHRFATSPPPARYPFPRPTLDTTMTREIGLHAEINHALPYRFAAWMSFAFFVALSVAEPSARQARNWQGNGKRWAVWDGGGARWSFDNDGIFAGWFFEWWNLKKCRCLRRKEICYFVIFWKNIRKDFEE